MRSLEFFNKAALVQDTYIAQIANRHIYITAYIHAYTNHRHSHSINDSTMTSTTNRNSTLKAT